MDRLNDGSTCFKYTSEQIISGNLVAVLGSSFYGKTDPGIFDPPCDAYASDGHGATFLNGYALPKSKQLGSTPDIASSFTQTDSIPYSMKAYVEASLLTFVGSEADCAFTVL